MGSGMEVEPRMPKTNVNNVEIEYETIGNPSSKPLLLIALITSARKSASYQIRIGKGGNCA
jgi:hypothetical protein